MSLKLKNTVFSILVVRVTAIVLHCEDTRAIQVGIDIGNGSDGYCLTVGGYAGMQVGFDIGNERADIVLQLKDTWGMQVCIDVGNESDG